MGQISVFTPPGLSCVTHSIVLSAMGVKPVHLSITPKYIHTDIDKGKPALALDHDYITGTKSLLWKHNIESLNFIVTSKGKGTMMFSRCIL